MNWAEDCRCCPNCYEVPCDAVMELDRCERRPCRCHEDPIAPYGVQRLCAAPRLIRGCPHLRAENGCGLPEGAACVKPEGDPP